MSWLISKIYCGLIRDVQMKKKTGAGGAPVDSSCNFKKLLALNKGGGFIPCNAVLILLRWGFHEIGRGG